MATINELFLTGKHFNELQTLLKRNVQLNDLTSDLFDFGGADHKPIARLAKVLSKIPTGLSVTALITELDQRPSVVKTSVDALLDRHLVAETDGKIVLTDAGHDFAQALDDRRDRIAKEAYGVLSADEQAQLLALMKKLIADYEARDVDFDALRKLH